MRNQARYFWRILVLSLFFSASRVPKWQLTDIPDPLVPANNEIRFHYGLEQQIGTKTGNYTYDTIGDNDVNFKIFDDDYISLKKVPLEAVICFKDINVSGNTSMEGALTAKQGVVVPTGASL